MPKTILRFIPNKMPNWENIQSLLDESKNRNQWVNFGPVSLKLECKLAELLNLDPSLSVIVTSSGTTALHALVQMHESLVGQKLHWGVSSFGFPCSVQGPLRGAHIFKCDDYGMLSMETPIHSKAIVVTNIFGMHKNLDQYRNENRIVIIDSATGFDNVDHGANEIISLHQTKPWGCGEGGCAIVEKQHESLFRSIINFGIGTNIHWGLNGKMSDFSAAMILDHLDKMDLPSYQKQAERIRKIAKANAFLNVSTMGYVTLIHNKPVEVSENPHFEIKKYYKPLSKCKNAEHLYERILCIPCHPEMSEISDQQIADILN